MKRILCMILAMLMLLGAAPACAEPSRSQVFHACIEEMHKYLNGEDCLPLEDVYTQLDGLNNYGMSYPLSKYAKVLLDIENNDFTWYIIPIQSMKQNARFVKWLEDYEWLGSLDQLEYYAAGREAEYAGDAATALSSYGKCIGFYDAERRLDTLQKDFLAAKYQQAIQEAKKGTTAGYRNAYNLLLEIEKAGGYQDSAFILEGVEALCATPTPKPAKTNTPRPTRKPTATPYNLRNARFYCEHSSSTVVYGYALIGQTCKIVADSARTRTGAGTNYPQTLEYVFGGEQFYVYDIDVASNGKVWYQIKVDGLMCWVSSGVASVNDLCGYILMD